MKSFGTSFLLLGANVVSITSSDQNPTTSRVNFHVPNPGLYQEGGYDHRLALFGNFPSSGKLISNVYYADSDLCDPNVDRTMGYPQRHQNQPWSQPYILVVDRGFCSFVTKVRHAQLAGASGVVIADNTCLCAAGSTCTPNDPDQVCATREPVVTDDGSGSDVSIPSVLLFKADADKLKDQLKNNQVVLMELTWGLPPPPDHRVAYELWTTPDDPLSTQFLEDFQTVAMALGDRAVFTPHEHIMDGFLLGCVMGEQQVCTNMCTNMGRYCALHPFSLGKGTQDRSVWGRDVVAESLRRLCIWQEYGSSNGIGAEWWSYVTEFTRRCSSQAGFVNETCVEEVYALVGVDSSRIKDCMQKSRTFAENDDTTNSLLQAEIGRRVTMVPTLLVDGKRQDAPLTATSVFATICNKYHPSNVPPVCPQCASRSDTIRCIQEQATLPPETAAQVVDRTSSVSAIKSSAP